MGGIFMNLYEIFLIMEVVFFGFYFFGCVELMVKWFIYLCRSVLSEFVFNSIVFWNVIEGLYFVVM